MKHVRKVLFALLLFSVPWLSGCQTNKAPEGATETETATFRSLAPQRVDIRGSIVMRRYNEGQVMLEVEGFGTSQYSRYDRAYVLVLPTTQIIDPDGRTLSMSELQQGQEVAIELRSGGQGNFIGMGVARKLWLEERL